MELAYKIVAIQKRGIMISPISYVGLAVQYKIGKWAKAHDSKHYLFVYRTLKNARKILKMIGGKGLIIIECETKNLRKAVGGGPVPEYRCTSLKPIRKIVG